ncbi:MAG: transcription elongation factor GreA [Dehalococcoidales bacterium]
MDINNTEITIAEIAARFAGNNPTEDGTNNEQILYHFVRWFGKDRVCSQITPPEIANYAERLSISDSEYENKLEILKTFLVYIKKERVIKLSLASHLKTKKSKRKSTKTVENNIIEKITLTSEGYEKAKNELEELKAERPLAIEEITKAAADKDFRENAPLDAAKERLALIEGKISELEELLKKAEIFNGCAKGNNGIGIGDRITIQDQNSHETREYILVSARESDPANGKISDASPLGKALIGKCKGNKIEVTVPAGILCYTIEKIEHLTNSKNKKQK